MSSETANGIDRQTGAGPRARIWRFRLFLLLAVLLTASMAWAANWASDNYGPGALDPTLVALATEIHNTASPTSTEPTASPSPTLPPAATRPSLYGTLFFAMRSGGHSHLWAYVPGDSSPIPLTTGDWDDRDPAVSPDGESLAFASDRDGPWDLYLLDLTTLAVTRLTSTPGFEGHPTWSPDGIWLAYEADYDGDLDIWILPVDGVGDAIQLTTQPGADQTPSWDPNGRRIAFATDRDGGMDIYLADLDSVDDRFRNLTRSPDAFDAEPAFHPAGTTIAFSSERDGVRRILALDPAAPSPASGEVGQGVSPAWSPDGLSLAAILLSPIDRYVAMYAVSSEGLPSLGVSITGAVSSLIWSPVGLPGEAASMGRSLPTPQPLYLIETVEPAPGSGRMRLTHVPDLSAPIEELSDAVDEAFIALRQRAAQDAGWDFLSSLEHAFVGLNDPLPPGFLWNDWLYTGRAFAFNPAVFDAGWVEVVREDIGGQTYWRVFVRANPQDGSLGEPLRQAPWDFQARYLGDPLSYDEGGALKPSIPSGYYIDFTTLAQDFAFERMPALPNWRTFYPAVRYNEFALTDGLDWMSAMLELYPPSAVITPTPYRTPTPTPSRTPRPTATPWWIIWRTPTSPPTATETPTPTQMQVP